MRNNLPITKEYFIKRLIDLCLRSGLSEFPKDNTAQHILLKSVVLTLGQLDAFTEKEINEKLKYWISCICKIKNIDHITLRRMLIDSAYLARKNDCSCYQVQPEAPGSQYFEDSINQINIMEVIKTGREEIARRKREYMQKRVNQVQTN